MSTVAVYSKPDCAQCAATRRALEKSHVTYQIEDVTPETAATLRDTYGYLQAPVVVTDTGEHWSGYRPDRIKALATD